MKRIDGGACAAQGFRASGIHCGIRKNKSKRDLALIVSDVRAAAAAVYTLNLVQGAPIAVTRKNIADGYARAMICNSGNANTCNLNGVEIAEKMCALVGEHLGIPASDVIVASTGVIGQPLDIAPIASGMEALAAGLEPDTTAAAEAIMTTDVRMKAVAVEFEVGGVVAKLGGIAKGSGMIHPNMATMLVFLTTDAAITPPMLRKALSMDVKRSFNRVSVDGDTSTNDMCAILANGLAGNPEIASEGADFDEFSKALNLVTVELCKMIARDGEGATKLIECALTGAADQQTADVVSKAVICSSLVKAAMFGADANWGRVLCAVGYAGADVDVSKVDVSFTSAAGTVEVCKGGAGVPFSEALAKKVLSEENIFIHVNLNAGPCSSVAWGCDLTYDYVKINGDYRT